MIEGDQCDRKGQGGVTASQKGCRHRGNATESFSFAATAGAAVMTGMRKKEAVVSMQPPHSASKGEANGGGTEHLLVPGSRSQAPARPPAPEIRRLYAADWTTFARWCRLLEKHGTKTRRSWRKLHLGVDADTGQIHASLLINHDSDDVTQVEPLLDQVEGPLASFTGDGAYDQDNVTVAIAERHPDATIIVPPRSNAVLSIMAETAPAQRDRHLQHYHRAQSCCLAEGIRIQPARPS